ncbi:MAG: hypothetical protein WC884_03220 [Candidatus Paceibacterota bacterium]
MSKRNFILLIIILIITIVIVFGFLYFSQPTSPTGDETEGTNFFSQFNPFGSGKTTTPPTTTPPVDISGDTGDQNPEIKQKLTKVSSMPIAGFTIFSKERLVAPVPILSSPSGEVPNGTVSTNIKLGTGTPTPPLTEFAPALRYVERATGNIYQTFIDKIEERRFTTTIIPKVYEAYFGNKAETVVMRYLKGDGRTIETFLGNLPKELLGGDTLENNEIKGSFLPNNIKDISVSSDNGSIFYLFNVGDSMVGTTLNLTTNKKVQIFSSPFTEWLSWWPNNNTNKMITLTTKPSANILGYMYSMTETGKNFNKILGNINGLTTLTSPDGKQILYSDNTLSLRIYNTDTKSSVLLGVKTLSEKCVWGSTSEVVYCSVPKLIDVGQYPDVWYQGEASFTDQFWKIDTKTGNATIIVDPTIINGGGEIDGTKLALDNNENYLFFVNKKDSFLWKLGLK